MEIVFTGSTGFFHNVLIVVMILPVISCANGNGYPGPIPGNYHLDILYGTVQDYTGNDGQWLNVYQADATAETPLFIWAHGNGHTYRDAHLVYESFITSLLDDGITVISWESIKQMDETNYTDIMADADIMFQWLGDHSSDYNLDMSKVFIGGHSRGTIASWNLAQSGEAGILGIYYGDAAGNLDDVNALDDKVTVDSPPIRMSYTQNKVTNDGQHDPNEGQKIIDLYRDLGFSETDSRLLVDQGYPSMTKPGFYSDLPAFCQYVLGL
jgi:acetyl esterase/lipase